ncbi:hypothetical protein SEA_ATUIN_280 [Arthrobacter phage Atuin]|nr:hypothetical protein SEA_ATUIN_79 [Arthrobacter phage Atuin]
MSNYDEAKGLLESQYSSRDSREVAYVKANALATLALADAISGQHREIPKQVHLLTAVDKETGAETAVVGAFWDKDLAEQTRDRYNVGASGSNSPSRYIVNTTGVR